MPHTKSAAKRLRQDQARRERNRAIRRELRTLIKRVREAVTAKDLVKAEAEFRVVAAKLDGTGARRVIHPNAAARVKSPFRPLESLEGRRHRHRPRADLIGFPQRAGG